MTFERLETMMRFQLLPSHFRPGPTCIAIDTVVPKTPEIARHWLITGIQDGDR